MIKIKVSYQEQDKAELYTIIDLLSQKYNPAYISKECIPKGNSPFRRMFLEIEKR